MASELYFTSSGIRWGNAVLSCLFDDEAGNRHFEIRTPRERVQVRVTPTGLVRVHKLPARP